MSEWTIFGVGVVTTMLLASGLFFTVREFRDIAKHPEKHEPHKQPGRKNAAIQSRSQPLKGYMKS